MSTARYVELVARGATVQADQARRIITGVVTPWNVYGHVSTGQRVAFAPGSLTLGERVKLILDHDPTQPVGVLASTSADRSGQVATFRVPGGPRGDDVLLEAAEGLRDGLSVGAEIDAADETPEGIYVTAARVRHVALLSEPAFDDARVTAVAASAPNLQEGHNVDTTAQPTPAASVATVTAGDVAPQGAHPVGGGPATAAPAPPPATQPTDAQYGPGEGVTITPAGRAVAAAGYSSSVQVMREPYPYAQPHHLGGPSFVRDAFEAMQNPSSAAAERWHRAQLMAGDALGAAMIRLDSRPAGLRAATGTTVTDPGLVPARNMPERFVPLIGAKAPLWSALTKYGTPDFSTLMVPRTLTETGLSGTGTDEVTPLPPGTITTDADQIVIEEVEGSYEFSRKLLMGSNPQIDQIAQAALDRAWLADVETRATAFFTDPANSTPFGSTYADGIGYTQALRSVFANMAAGTQFVATVSVPASAEYVVAAEADDTTERPLLPYGPQVNALGDSAAGYQTLMVQGIPLLPGPYMDANTTVVLDQDANAAVAWTTPMMSFRLEWTGDGNYKKLKLVKYSGVGFWAQYPGGVVVVTNTTPLPLAQLGPGSRGTLGVPEATALPASSEERTTEKARK